jgi:hypothetical protein
MDLKTLVKVLKKVVREEVRSVIKEELSEILQDGLQSTINEMSLTKTATAQHHKLQNLRKRKLNLKKINFQTFLTKQIHC